ncbi:MAG TPA: lipase maturation factor family protein [Gemmatimonadaceae bacterium]|nr:lipase maturation factor family protein [Gemmatimonadaceae bacterium]
MTARPFHVSGSSLFEFLAARATGVLVPRWIFLRALGLIFFSAFYSLARQTLGLIGERGILPVGSYLQQVGGALHGVTRYWYAPSIFWARWDDGALVAAVAAGIVCSLLLTANIWPRLMIAVCTLLFLSFIATLQDFSSYQSDGMLLEAGFISIWFAPRGLRPRLGAHDPPSLISLFMLRWEWFRIYFESGLVKLMSGDVHWRDLTAMDDYYQNGPLPAWPGWYVQHLPHWFHASTVIVTLVVELVVVWAVFMPRRVRLACFVIVTGLQVGIIATANYAFLNYLVLMLGVLLLDDRALAWIVARVGARRRIARDALLEGETLRPELVRVAAVTRTRSHARVIVEGLALGWVFYATLLAFLAPASGTILGAPERVLAPFRIANAYGLFAMMTEQRYEIEFQGSDDGGRTWTAYPFRYKPQDPAERPGIYAPYQPRFEWNLWFASLAPWQASEWVVAAQARLATGSKEVLSLFRRDPFNGHPPAMVRTVRWQYWFTSPAARRKTGAWWTREYLGEFAGVVSRDTSGRLTFTPPGGE